MAKNEAKIKFNAETSEFNDQIKKANSELSELRAELKLNETQMKATGASVEGLEDKQRMLTAQLDASADKVAALSNKVEKAAEIFGENSDEVAKLRTQLINAQTAEEKARQALSACNDELEAQRAAAKKAESAVETLTDTIDEQQDELDALKKKYADAVLSYGKTSDEAKALAREIKDLSGDLKKNKTDLSAAERQADKLDKSLDELGDSAGGAGDGFTVFGGALADLASSAIQGCINKIGEFTSYLSGLPAETREIRQDMVTLSTSFDEMGFSTETATETWKDLYAIFGEDDRAVEASNLIAKMCDNEKDLAEWVTITTGIYGTYQDSLPVEALAESANETAKCGKITGNLADALNWSREAADMFAGYMSDEVVTAEDAFNVALSECTTEQERQQLITETLTKLYGGAAETYRETAGAQMEAKEAAADQILAENDLASAIEPVTTAFTELKNELLEGIKPAVETVSGVFVDAINWMREHPTVLKAVAAAVGVLAVGLGGLAVVVGVYTAAQLAMNSAILASPITWIVMAVVAAIAAVVAAVVVVIEKWDEISAACISAWETIKATLAGWGDWINTNVIQPVREFFVGLWDGITSACSAAWDFICNAVSVAIMFVGSLISAAFQIITLPFRAIWENCKGIITSAWNAIKTAVSNAITAVKNTILKVWNAIKTALSPILNGIKSAISTAWNAVKTAVSSVVNSIKSAVSTAWNGIKTAVSNVMNGIKSGVSSAWNSVKSTISNVVTSIKSKVTSVFNSVKTAITKPIDAAKNAVKNALDSIKGFFSNLQLKFPSIKLPHFKITGKFSLDPPSVPKLGIEWYKDGGILTRPTIFGINGGNFMAGGEAGHEAILPIDRLEGYITSAIQKTVNNVNVDRLAAAVEKLAERPIEMNINGRKFATATAGSSDSVNGMRNVFKARGLEID